MTRDQAMAAADRAANAAGRYGPDPGAWLVGECAEDLIACARLVRDWPEFPACNIYARLYQRHLAVPWSRLNPRRRVALEVFRASLLALDRLVAADTAAAA